MGVGARGDAAPGVPASPLPAGKRSSRLAGWVYGVPSPRYLSDQQRWLVHQAVRECGPIEVDELDRLARGICEAHSRSQLAAAAAAVSRSNLGPYRLRLLRAAYARADRSLKLIAEAMGDGPWNG